jgi:hypothetical protein
MALLRGLRKSEGISAELTIIKAANAYWEETTGENFFSLPGTAWIRLSTGKLCMDVGNGDQPCGLNTFPVRLYVRTELPEFKLTEGDLRHKLLSTLGLDDFYCILLHDDTRWLRWASSTPETIILPSIRNPSCNPAHFEPNEFCAIPTAKHLTPDAFFIGSWYTDDLPLEVLPTGWTRCACGCFPLPFSNNRSIGLTIQSVAIETHIGCGSP